MTTGLKIIGILKSKLVKNGFQPLPTWQDALERYLKEIL